MLSVPEDSRNAKRDKMIKLLTTLVSWGIVFVVQSFLCRGQHNTDIQLLRNKLKYVTNCKLHLFAEAKLFISLSKQTGYKTALLKRRPALRAAVICKIFQTRMASVNCLKNKAVSVEWPLLSVNRRDTSYCYWIWNFYPLRCANAVLSVRLSWFYVSLNYSLILSPHERNRITF